MILNITIIRSYLPNPKYFKQLFLAVFADQSAFEIK